MHPLQMRLLMREGPNPRKRRTLPGLPNGVSQSLQRGSEGIVRLIRLTVGFQQKCPRLSPVRTRRHSSSAETLALRLSVCPPPWVVPDDTRARRASGGPGLSVLCPGARIEGVAEAVGDEVRAQ